MAKPVKTPERSPKEKINEAIKAAQEILDDVTDNWEKFYYDNVKKGAKAARKGSLELKKKAAEIRSNFQDIDL